MVSLKLWAGLVKHVRDKVEDHYWYVDRLGEYYSAPHEFVISDDSSDDDSDIDDEDNPPLDPISDSDNTLAAQDIEDMEDYLYQYKIIDFISFLILCYFLLEIVRS